MGSAEMVRFLATVGVTHFVPVTAFVFVAGLVARVPVDGFEL
jgi:hypothetical protein